MIGLGTIVNVFAIIFGGMFGLFFGKRLKASMHETLTKTAGLAVLMLGLGGTMEKMLQVTKTGLSSKGSMMLIFCLTIGAMVGEWLDIEKRLVQFGIFLKQKSHSENDSQFLEAFVTSSLTVCIGAMAVVGAFEDGLHHNYAILFAKAILDFIIILIMASSMGKGSLFSFIPVGIFQGSLTLLAHYLAPLISNQGLSQLSFIGSILIFCVGVNLFFGPKIKVANLLPSLILALLWQW